MKSTAQYNRENWLADASALIQFYWSEHFGAMPAHRIACGYPEGKRNIDGACAIAAASADHTVEMWIGTHIDCPEKAFTTLIHEMIHAIDGNKSKHGGRFATIARKIGLIAPLTSAVASPELQKTVATLVKQLPAYPHAKLTNGVKKDKNRQLKLHCRCGFICRASQSQIAKLNPAGAPCPCCGDHSLVAAL